MQHPVARIMTLIVAAAAVLTLAACSGGGGGGEETPDPVDLLLDDRVIGLQRVVERSDSLLVPGLHVGYSISIDGGARQDEGPFFQAASCSGPTTCETENMDGSTGSTLMLRNLMDFSNFELGPAAVSLDSRGGFDTVDIAADVDVSGSLPDDLVNVTLPNARTYGFWGARGFAGVLIGDGPVSGEARKVVLGGEGTDPFEGELSFGLAFAMGQVSGTNPVGVGSLTWGGIVEAVSTRTFERRSGTVEVIIADLNQDPLRVSVNVEVADDRVGPPEWSNVEITGGSFTHGTTADQNFLEGNLHGPNHEEAYGVFDTGAYTGAFGARQGS